MSTKAHIQPTILPAAGEGAESPRRMREINGRASGLLLGLLLIATASFAREASPVRIVQADTAAKVDFNIPKLSLADALAEWSKQTGLQVLRRDTDGAVELTTRGVTGKYSPAEALEKMLAATGLTYEFVNDRTVRIAPARTDAQTTSFSRDGRGIGGMTLAQNTGTPNTGTAGPQNQEEKSSSKQQKNPAVNPDKDSAESLQEIIVTAQKRTERIQDVPVPVTAISGDTLLNDNQLLLRDMFSSFPGFGMGTLGSQQYLGIRGINTGNGNPSVGLTVDDVPFGSSTNSGGGENPPDIDPNDVARVEVLRGPQGTLYGVSSLGGLIKYVTVDPSTAGVSGRVQAGLSSVVNGAQLGYNVRGSLNVPLSDTLAVRMSGFTRLDPGYIDNPGIGVDGVNEVRVNGGRLAALWRPSEALSLKLSALYQRSDGDGLPEALVQPGLSGLQQNYISNTGGYVRSAQAYSATLTAKLGAVDLTSLSGYNINSFSDSRDGTYALGPLTQMLFGVAGTPLSEDAQVDKFSQEIRLSVPIGRNFEWLLGGFYTHESTEFNNIISAQDIGTGAIVGQWAYIDFPSTYQEYAGFTDLTWHFTERFDVQFGGRYSSFKQKALTTIIGPYAALLGMSSPVVYPTGVEKADAFTYLVTPRFVFSPDLMLYARFASGYRPGGANLIFGDTAPKGYAPDKTNNYEIGLKGDFLDHALSIDASVYYIRWQDIQLSLVDLQTFTGYIGNGSQAKSQGVELSVQSRPAKGLTIGAWVAFNDAVLTEDFPANSTAHGLSGDRLPYSSRWSANVSLDQQFPLGGRFNGFVGTTVSYVGDRLGGFGATPQRQDFPEYAKVDLRVGVKDDAWTVNLFAANITDKRGLLSGGLGYAPQYAFVYIQPRTIGLSVARSF